MVASRAEGGSWETGEVNRAKFNEFDACAAALLDWEIEAIQLDRGPFAGEVIQTSSPAALVSEITFGRALHQRGEPPRGMRTLGVPADPMQRIFFRDHWTEGDQLMFFPHGSELDSVSLPGFHVFSVSYEEERLSGISQALAGTDYAGLLAGRDIVRCAPGVMRAVRGAIRRFMNVAASRGDADAQAGIGETDAGEDLLHTIVEVLALAGDPRPPDFSHARRLAIRRSLDLLDASEQEPLSVAELCRAAGVSRRTLEYAFRERFDLSPKAYMLARRLDAVRAELRCARRESVTRVANQWGFDHLSRFASLYRRQFGELPSETVRANRSAGRAPTMRRSS